MIICTQFISILHPFLSFVPLPGLVSFYFMCALSWRCYCIVLGTLFILLTTPAWGRGAPQPERSPRFRLPLSRVLLFDTVRCRCTGRFVL